MHYYSFNIGDYQSHTSHLSDIEDLVYRRLLDWYYLHEAPIPLDEAEVSRQIRMRTHTESIAIVLREYFEYTEDGWIHRRANKEIAKADDKSEKAKASANARWNKKDANALPAQSDSNATHNTLPKTQDTKHIKEKAQRGSRLANDFLIPADWILFCEQERPELNTEKTFNQFKDYWVAQPGQKGVKLNWAATWRNWVRNTTQKLVSADIIRTTVPPSKLPDPALEKIKADEKKAAPLPDHIRQAMEVLRKKA